jgi:hypothetical protein
VRKHPINIIPTEPANAIHRRTGSRFKNEESSQIMIRLNPVNDAKSSTQTNGIMAFDAFLKVGIDSQGMS